MRRAAKGDTVPKHIPDCPAKPQAPPLNAVKEYRIELLTPMFGGGIVAGMPDPLFPIRPTTIRGQLEFWWRATWDASSTDLEALRSRQTAVWGSTERASPVGIEVRDVEVSSPRPCAKYVWNPNARRKQGGYQIEWQAPFRANRDFRDDSLPYALFPFQGKPPKPSPGSEPEKYPGLFVESGRFTLRMRFPEILRADVEAAVRAWANFGSLGARGRRGCGSLYCEEIAPESVEQVGTWFKAIGPARNVVREWPTFPPSIFVRPEAGPPVQVWDWIIGRFRHFRQGEEFARNRGPGRSRFPEPETVRRITLRRWEKHEPWDMPDGFPRAELGLPIVFHFKDDNKGEPTQTTLLPYVNGETRERMASPIILKPLALADRRAVPLILPLVTAGVQQVELQNEEGQCLTPRRAVPVRSPEFSVAGSPLHSLSAAGSALDGFLNFVRLPENGFVEHCR